MFKFERSVIVNAPVEIVFDYCAGQAFYTECGPSVVGLKYWELQPNGGHSFQCQHKLAGRQFEGSQLEQIEFVPNHSFIEKGGDRASEVLTTYQFKPVNGGTKVTITSESKMTIPVLGWVFERVMLAPVGIREVEGLLKNLKQKMETN